MCKTLLQSVCIKVKRSYNLNKVKNNSKTWKYIMQLSQKNSQWNAWNWKWQLLPLFARFLILGTVDQEEDTDII